MGEAGLRRERPLLEIDNLYVRFDTPQGCIRAVNGVYLHLDQGEIVAIVGESGSGKSVTGQAVLGILRSPPAVIHQGAIHYKGRNLLEMSPGDRRELRGRSLSMVFQDALAALNPVLTVGDQMQRLLKYRGGLSRAAAKDRTVELFRQVGIPAAESRLGDYPHQFSGGMRQRVMIAMAIALSPDVLIADEPTTALDVTIQAQILALLRDIQRETDMGVLLITHDLGVVAEVADRVVVLYVGRVVEEAPTAELLRNPRHPYTEALIRSAPSAATRGGRLAAISGSPPDPRMVHPGCPFSSRCAYAVELCLTRPPEMRRQADWAEGHRTACHRAEDVGRQEPALGQPKQWFRSCAVEPCLSFRNVAVWYASGRSFLRSRPKRSVRAVDGVSLDLFPGETLGLVGESGCGKSTLVRTAVGMQPPDRGEVVVLNQDVTRPNAARRRWLARHVQMVFQDPYRSLDPRMTVEDLIAEGLDIHGLAGSRAARRRRVGEVLEQVGLSASIARQYPHEFSGGQRQRIGIARALMLEPRILLCDEPVSSLDVSVQAQILNLLQDIQAERELSLLIVTHDLTVVDHLADRIAVMYLGQVVEVGPAGEAGAFQHPYSRALRESAPDLGAATEFSQTPESLRSDRVLALAADMPDPSNPPRGCRFHTRCPVTQEGCDTEPPKIVHVGANHYVACVLATPLKEAN